MTANAYYNDVLGTLDGVELTKHGIRYFAMRQILYLQRKYARKQMNLESILAALLGTENALKLIQERCLSSPGSQRWHRSFPEVIMASYFTSRPDPQTGRQIDPDQEAYIYPWYSSMRRHKIHGIIFHDGLSPAFTSRFQTNRIRFVSCSPGPRSLNDEPYLIYLRFLLDNPYQRVFFTDICDVTVKKPPFFLFNRPLANEILFVGRDRFNLNGHSHYIRRLVRNYKRLCQLKIDPWLANCPMYNSGIIGGSYKVILFLLMAMAMELLPMEKGLGNNMNMLVLNHVIHRQFYETPKYTIFKNPFKDTTAEIEIWGRLSKLAGNMPMPWIIPAGLTSEEVNGIPVSFETGNAETSFQVVRAEHVNTKIFSEASGINLSPGVIPHWDHISQTKYICSGEPLCSPFYAFNEDCDACFIHK